MVSTSSRLAAFLAGKTDFGPEYQQVVRRLDLAVVKQRKPNVQLAEYTWFTSGAVGFKIDKPPFNDIRVRRALSRATNQAEVYESNAFSQGHWTPNPVVPAAFILACLYMLYSSINYVRFAVEFGVAVFAGLAIMALGIPLYFIAKNR